MIVKERLVQPTNFEISKKATDFHHITQQEAVTEGLPLEDVLREFMLDMVDLYHRGGRVVIHHLEFDASIIARELERANLVELSMGRSCQSGHLYNEPSHLQMGSNVLRFGVGTCLGREHLAP